MSVVTDLRKQLAPIKQHYWKSRFRDRLLRLLEAPRHHRAVLGCTSRFILFLVPGVDFVNGGIISMLAIAEESERQRAIHHATTLVCTPHGDTRITRFTKFENDIHVLAFDDLILLFPPHSEILVHVPEAFAGSYVADVTNAYQQRPDITWRFNILLQNIDLIPSRETVAAIARIGQVTATTAHASYGNAQTAEILGCPIHHLSTATSPRNFRRVPYSAKKKLIIISPDPHPAKSETVQKIREALPDHRVLEIRNMTYRKYRQTIEKAKFAFTFGEGLDGYFIETIFSGGIGMAVYNERFFQPQYSGLDGVFADFEAAKSTVTDFMRDANSEEVFQKIASRQFEVTARNYVYDEYVSNLRSYYREYFGVVGAQDGSRKT